MKTIFRNQRPLHFRIGTGLIYSLLWCGFLSADDTRKYVRVPDPWAGKPVMSAQHANEMVYGRLHNAPKVGEKAPVSDFVEAMTGRIIPLSRLHADKPVVLFFASWSCICAQESSPPMKVLSEKYKDLCHFVLVYIVEAHPVGGFTNPERGRKYDTPSPLSFSDRIAKSIRFAEDHKFKFPIFVDALDDRLAVKWGAWPVRLFVVDRSGTVVFAGKQGPWFHKPTRDFDPNLEGVPHSLGKIPGYSEGSLEEFLENLATRRAVPPVRVR